MASKLGNVVFDCADPDRLSGSGGSPRTPPGRFRGRSSGAYREYHDVMADPEGNEFCVH